MLSAQSSSLTILLLTDPIHDEDHNESEKMHWSKRIIMMVAQIISSYMTGDTDHHNDHNVA